MKDRLHSASWWKPALFMGTFFGVAMALFVRLDDPEAFGGGASALIVSAPITGALTAW